MEVGSNEPFFVSTTCSERLCAALYLCESKGSKTLH